MPLDGESASVRVSSHCWLTLLLLEDQRYSGCCPTTAPPFPSIENAVLFFPIIKVSA